VMRNDMGSSDVLEGTCAGCGLRAPRKLISNFYFRLAFFCTLSSAAQ
jgi:hypothetical protein